ncbi:MAG: hypothetical protein ABMA64_09460 [Myxococcota bacterium]
MRRTLLLASLGAAGCFDFVGDRGRIGFATNLVVDGQPWDARSPVADHTVAQFLAVERIEDQRSDGLTFESHARGLDQVEQSGGSIAVTGAHQRGLVWFTGDAEDQFSVAFTAPETVQWRHAFGGEVGDVWIRAGATVPLAAAVRDRRGRPVAYAHTEQSSDLTVEADGDGVVWADAPSFAVNAGDTGPMTLRVSLLGRPLPAAAVTVVPDSAVVSVELAPIRIGEVCGALAVGRTAAGHPVLGAARVVHEEGADPDYPDVAMWTCEGPVPVIGVERAP